MRQANIVIFDPHRAGIAGDVSQMITSEMPHRVTIVKSDPSPDVRIKPDADLIFVVLDSCKNPGHKKQFTQFLSKYQFTPIVTILNCNEVCPDCPVLRQFVWSFVTTPFTKKAILLHVQKFLPPEKIDLYDKIYVTMKTQTGFQLLKGNSPVILEVKAKILRIAPYDVTVLLQGETGTGKELCAKMIHYLSNRSQKAFVPVNCGALPSELIENELFGHKKGAYTNASTSEEGLICAADGGTLFLDEIEAIPEATQVKLLRFLEDKKYKPLGDSSYRTANVRILSAAKENLQELINQNNFREDLYYRLNVVQISLPPLRVRNEDIPVLTDHFIKRYSVIYQKEIKGITPQALMKLMHHEWQGNVRELENVIQESVVMNLTGWIEAEDLDMKKLEKQDEDTYPSDSFKRSKEQVVHNFENTYLKSVMLVCRGNISQAARLAQKDRRAFCRLLKKHDINPADFRS